MELTDEIIMAFVDGDLDFSEYQTVAKLIDNDNDALKKVEVYKKSKKILYEEFGHLRDKKPPKFLVDTVQKHFKKKSNILYFIPREQLLSMAATLFIGLFVGIFVMDLTNTRDDNLLLDQSARHVSPTNNTNNTNDTHSIFSINIDGLKSGFTRLSLITELTIKLQDSPDAQRYNITIGEDKFPLIIAANFIDSKGRECKILNSKIKDIDYISACQMNNEHWEIKFIE